MRHVCYGKSSNENKEQDAKQKNKLGVKQKNKLGVKRKSKPDVKRKNKPDVKLFSDSMLKNQSRQRSVLRSEPANELV